MLERTITLGDAAKSTGFAVRPAFVPMNVQEYLTRRGSGLAKVTIGGVLGFGVKTAASIIESKARQYLVRPEYILVVLQAEQSLVTDPTVRSADFTVYSLKETGDVMPAARHAGRVYKNTGTDGNRFVEVTGDMRMFKATGAGIPDPNLRPPWDIRPYLGFANQVDATARFARRDFEKWHNGTKLVTLYGGETVIAGDPETFALLTYTPSPDVLVNRPKIFKMLGFT